MREYKETSLNNRVRKDVAFILFTVLLVMVLVIFISETVMSQTTDKIEVDEAYYLQLESEYLKEIRTYLQAEGFENSGVTMTHVVETNGARSYEVKLHHKKLEKLNAECREALLEKIENMAFEMPGCCFEIQLFS